MLYFARRLQKIDHYLPGGVSLFEYLDQPILGSKGRLHVCRLPLALVISSQTGRLWQSEYRNYSLSEMLMPLNKKYHRFEDIIARHKR